MPALHLYDFDGTLFRSPQPPAMYGGSWWNEGESLSLPHVPDDPGPEFWVSETVASARRSIADPDVLAVLSTGRGDRSEMRYRVPELLRSIGLRFDEVYLSPIEDVTRFKSNLVRRLLSLHPIIDEFAIWDDRRDQSEVIVQAAISSGIKSGRVSRTIVRAKSVEVDPSAEPDAIEVARKYRETRRPAYLGIFLDSRSRGSLVHEFSFVHEKLEADHVTLAFHPIRFDVEPLLGRRVSFTVVGHAVDDHCQVVAVRLPSDIPCSNRIPHVTLSTTPGALPKYANDLLARGFETVSGPTLTGIIGVK